MNSPRRSIFLLFRTAAIVIVLTVAYLFLTDVPTVIHLNQSGNSVSVPTVAPLPTFGLSSEIAAKISNSTSPYLCSQASMMGPVELATCTDCQNYPVSKTSLLSVDYAPKLVDTGLPGGGKLIQAAKDALVDLFVEAHLQHLSPVITSAYRSYNSQVDTFNAWVAQEIARGVSKEEALNRANRYSARPGQSEHQLGTAVDLNCASCVPFDTQSAKNLELWKFLEAHAHEYGFVVSYPAQIEALTGYQAEPWHIRYVGIEMATKLYDAGYLNGSGVCLLGLLKATQSQNDPSSLQH